MRVIIADDERAGAQYIARLCAEIDFLKVIKIFTNPREALEYLRGNPVDLAFLDVEMPEVTGMEIAQIIKAERIPTAVVFVTGYEQYALPTFKADAVSYLLKPCEKEEVLAAAEKALRLTGTFSSAVKIQTFDHFDVFLNDMPLRFANAKAKELLAVLVDRRGADVTMGYIIDILWPDREYDENVKQLYRKAVSYLNHFLTENGIRGLFSSGRGSCHVNPAAFRCDYYDFLDGTEAARQKFNGKYMFEYSWAEETLALLLRDSAL